LIRLYNNGGSGTTCGRLVEACATISRAEARPLHEDWNDEAAMAANGVW